MRRVCSFVPLLPAFLLVPLHSSAQTPTCKRFKIADTHLPVFPPIARAAHISATIRFTVVITPERKSHLSFLDGPNEGLWQTLVKSAYDYLSSREYEWSDGKHDKSCSYIASVEFRGSGEAVEPPNNFFRVTVVDETHTIVEVRPTTEAVMF